MVKRARFVVEATRACIAVWGADRVGVRLSPMGGFGGMAGDAQWREQHLEVARQLQAEGVAYIDLVNQGWAYGQPGFDEAFLRDYRTLFRGALFLSGGFTRELAQQRIAAGLCDAAVFGRAFIANPDLPMRFLRNLPLTEGDQATYYGGAERGYTDYARAE